MPKPVIAGLYYGGVDHFIAPGGRPMVTGIRKRPAATGFLGTTGFPDDASSEPAHHTQDKTVHLFSNENYRLLEARLGVVLPRPTFGENLTTAGTLENNVYVGDHFRVGKAVICVTQPTERCKTIGRSLGVPTILKALHELELCGFYARVVRPGSVDADDIVELCERPQVAWSIKRLHQIMFRQSACIKLCFVNFRTTNLSIKFWPSVSFQPNGRNDSKLCEDGSDAASR